jgi:hypothetical protein
MKMFVGVFLRLLICTNFCYAFQINISHSNNPDSRANQVLDHWAYYAFSSFINCATNPLGYLRVAWNPSNSLQSSKAAAFVLIYERELNQYSEFLIYSKLKEYSAYYLNYSLFSRLLIISVLGFMTSFYSQNILVYAFSVSEDNLPLASFIGTSFLVFFLALYCFIIYEPSGRSISSLSEKFLAYIVMNDLMEKSEFQSVMDQDYSDSLFDNKLLEIMRQEVKQKFNEVFSSCFESLTYPIFPGYRKINNKFAEVIISKSGISVSNSNRMSS